MKLKKFFIATFFMLIFLFSISNISLADEDSLNITAKSAYLIDNMTDKVLFSKNENDKMYPASTTKILTAIIVLEHCNLDDVVTASPDAVMSIPEGYSTANIQINEQLTVQELLELLLVHSANDAANVLAEFVGGSIDSFVSIMNTKLSDLELNDSHFTNTFGMHDENHYTTAHDLAYILKYCLKNETFRKLAGKASCAIPSTNLYGTRTYSSTNELLLPQNTNYYKYLTAGKTGFTSQAKECLVSSAYKNDLELIGVVLGSDSRFTDTIKLYEYGYSNYSLKSIVPEGSIATTIQISKAKYNSKNLNLLVSEEILAIMPNSLSISDIPSQLSLPEKISAPIEEGSVLGTITYNVDGISYTSNLIAANSVEKSKLLNYIILIGICMIFLLLLYRILFFKKLEKK